MKLIISVIVRRISMIVLPMITCLSFILDFVSIYVFAFAQRLQQPIPWLMIWNVCALSRGKGKGAIEKIQLIEPHLPRKTNLILDIGSNSGFFSFSLAQKGYYVIGVEPDYELFSIAQRIGRIIKSKTAVFFCMPFDSESALILPRVDVTLCLSVFQQWCYYYGFDVATHLLRVAWEKTNNCMFFETPNTVENHKIRKWLPNMGLTIEDAKGWIHNLLSSLPNSEVVFLGHVPADFRPDESRHIFLIKKVN